MNFVGRVRELGLLRRQMDRREAGTISITGPGGSGKTALALRAVGDFPKVVHLCPPLPDPTQRALLAARLRGELARMGRREPPPEPAVPSWAELLGWVVAAADPALEPLVLVFDDAHRLVEARSRIDSPLQEAIAKARAGARPWHAVFIGRPGAVPPNRADPGAPDLHLDVGPLSFRSVSGLLPGSRARDRLEAYGVFGGLPGTLRHVDPAAPLGANIRRLLLLPGGALADEGVAMLERDLQTPSRYAAILTALSGGEADWGVAQAGVSDLTTSGQVAPYLARLEEMGIVRRSRPLDSGPRSRKRRYRITDPFHAFWFRLAALRRWEMGEGSAPGAAVLRDAVEAQAAAVFPHVCRQYMRNDGMERLGSNARECGGLWSARYDMNVSGMLKSGAAFYGIARWPRPDAGAATPPGLALLHTLDEAVRETRYGFGREARLRMIFLPTPPPPELARAEDRREDTLIFTPAHLAGSA